MTSIVFLASGGRTGTKFLGKRLSEVLGDSFSVHEPDVVPYNVHELVARIRTFGLRHMIFGRLRGTHGLRNIGHRYLAGWNSRLDTMQELHAQRDRYYDQVDENLIIESNFRFWMVADLLPLCWPDSRTVGIIRDPRDWIESWRAHRPYRHARFFLGWFPLGPLRPKHVGDNAWESRWGNFGQFGRLGWDWRVTYQTLDAACERLRDAKMFRYEDIFSDPLAMDHLLQFASYEGRFPVSKEIGFADVRSNQSQGKRSWQDWTPSEAQLVDELCGPLMRKYGYGGEPEWLSLLKK